MAENSKREQIICRVIEEVKCVPVIKTVVRGKKTHHDLQQFALPQFPVAAVVGKLPRPVEKKSNRMPGAVDLIKSSLAIDVFIYDMVEVIDDTTEEKISSLADDVWVALYNDPLKNGLCLETTLNIEDDPEYWEPFLAFRMIANTVYLHTTGGI